MKVKVCRNCKLWDQQGRPELTIGVCCKNSYVRGDHVDIFRTLESATCSAFAYRQVDATDDDHKGVGGDDDGPVDITPRGPGGEQIYPQSARLTVDRLTPAAAWEEYAKMRMKVIPYDPDGDKKD